MATARAQARFRRALAEGRFRVGQFREGGPVPVEEPVAETMIPAADLRCIDVIESKEKGLPFS